AKKYGITTPYTSWLIVPDAPVPVARGMGGMGGTGGTGTGFAPPPGPTSAPALQTEPGRKPVAVEAFARQAQGAPGGVYAGRYGYETKDLAKGDPKGPDAEAKR